MTKQKIANFNWITDDRKLMFPSANPNRCHPFSKRKWYRFQNYLHICLLISYIRQYGYNDVVHKQLLIRSGVDESCWSNREDMYTSILRTTLFNIWDIDIDYNCDYDPDDTTCGIRLIFHRYSGNGTIMLSDHNAIVSFSEYIIRSHPRLEDVKHCCRIKIIHGIKRDGNWIGASHDNWGYQKAITKKDYPELADMHLAINYHLT